MKFWRYIICIFVGFLGGLWTILYRSDIAINNFLGTSAATGSGQDILGSMDERMQNIMKTLREGYFYEDRIDENAMKKRAIKSYVDGLKDPYTVYLDAEENKELNEGLTGEEDFEGIGAKVMKKDQGVMIEEVLKNSPALKAGLRPLDIIVSINGTGVNNESLRESVERIRGPKGTEVELTIRRGVDLVNSKKKSDPEVLTVKVTRDAISYPSVLGETWNIGDKRVGYIVVSSVGEHTDELFRQTVKTMQGSVSAVVLDLRGNGGGFLHGAVKLGSYFLDRGVTIVKDDYRVYRDEVLVSYGFKGFQGLPVVVLVDGYTASAGEILALALREQINAKIIGEKSFGKGTIQTIKELDDGSSLKYTVGERLPPSGISINGTGIVPDMKVPFDKDQFAKDATDNQIEYTKQYLQKILKNSQ